MEALSGALRVLPVFGISGVVKVPMLVTPLPWRIEFHNWRLLYIKKLSLKKAIRLRRSHLHTLNVFT